MFYLEEMRVIVTKPSWKAADETLKTWLENKARERATKRAKEELYGKRKETNNDLPVA